MTERAMQFLERWVAENLAKEPHVATLLETPEALLARLLEEAHAEDISRTDLEEEAGDLASFMTEAQESKADEEGEDDDQL